MTVVYDCFMAINRTLSSTTVSNGKGNICRSIGSRCKPPTPPVGLRPCSARRRLRKCHAPRYS